MDSADSELSVPVVEEKGPGLPASRSVRRLAGGKGVVQLLLEGPTMAWSSAARRRAAPSRP